MSVEKSQNLTLNENLLSSLLSTLDEDIFFAELGGFLHTLIGSDNTSIYIVKEDLSAELVSINGEVLSSKSHIAKGEGPVGHIIRTKRPYFSNNAQRDPVFMHKLSENVNSELCVPVSHEGIVIGSVHFQNTNAEKSFSREHINQVLEILNFIKKPLSNMKMYLAAKHLNQSLQKQVEVKEKELREKSRSVTMNDSFKIEEKPIMGKSPAMKEALHLADKAAAGNINVLLTGEAGCGKEMISRRIHCRGHRAEAAFISIDCEAYHELQLEEEIFGKEIRDGKEHHVKPGMLELAQNGTIFISNISSLSIHLQSKLNLFIQDKLAFRVGGQVPYKADVRIISSTRKDLTQMVSDGLFREDLFYSLSTIKIKVPSLKDRKEDVIELAMFFLNHKRKVEEQKSFSPGALKALEEYTWPGNVRELQNVVERAYILSDNRIVEKDHLSEQVTTVQVPQDDKAESEAELYKFSQMTLDELERRHICMTLDHLSGNKTKTAKVLGITVKTLYNKLHSYGLIEAKEAQ